jgi:chromosome segregation ATPase
VPENQAKVHIKLIEKNMNYFAEHHLANKDDIQNIKDDIHNIKGDVHNLKGNVHSLKSDVHNLKEDVHNIKGDIQNLKGDIQNLKGDIKDLKSDVKDLKGGMDGLWGEIGAVEVKLNAEIRLVTREIDILRTDTNRNMEALGNVIRSDIKILDQASKERFKFSYWMIGVLASGIGAIIGRDYLLSFL